VARFSECVTNNDEKVNTSRGEFFDGSKTTKGRQALQNILACMKEIIEPWLDQELNDDAIRILMKKSFF